jgi:DNA-binding transcriptional regulator YiaG
MDGKVNVKLIRTKLGLTQEQLGKAIGVDQSTVSNWENGASPSGPARRLLQSLALTAMLRSDAETAV